MHRTPSVTQVWGLWEVMEGLGTEVMESLGTVQGERKHVPTTLDFDLSFFSPSSGIDRDASSSLACHSVPPFLSGPGGGPSQRQRAGSAAIHAPAGTLVFKKPWEGSPSNFFCFRHRFRMSRVQRFDPPPLGRQLCQLHRYGEKSGNQDNQDPQFELVCLN